MKNTYLSSAFAANLLIASSGRATAQAVVRASAPAASRPAAAPAAAPTVAAPAAAVTFAEEMPRFRGHGLDSAQAYVQHHLRYPDDAFIANASGRVYVGFVVNPQGQVEQVKVVKSVFPSLDREAQRVVAALPAWSSPGRQHGQPVSVAYTIAVVFQMEMAMLNMRAKAGQPAAHATKAASAAGPSFPGGPDSLRTYLVRGARRAGPTAQGLVVVEFDIDNSGRPQNISTLKPAAAKERATPPAYAAAVRLVEQFPAWLLGAATGRARHQVLPIAFGTATLPPMVTLEGLRYPTYPGTEPTLESLTLYIQRQAKYPPEAADLRQQGRVYVSFQMSEAGEVEQVQIIGSAAPLLDAEVLRVIKSLPRATTPAISSGQAVRTSFTLPVSFVMH